MFNEFDGNAPLIICLYEDFPHIQIPCYKLLNLARIYRIRMAPCFFMKSKLPSQKCVSVSSEMLTELPCFGFTEPSSIQPSTTSHISSSTASVNQGRGLSRWRKCPSGGKTNNSGKSCILIFVRKFSVSVLWPVHVRCVTALVHSYHWFWYSVSLMETCLNVLPQEDLPKMQRTSYKCGALFSFMKSIVSYNKSLYQCPGWC